MVPEIPMFKAAGLNSDDNLDNENPKRCQNDIMKIHNLRLSLPSVLNYGLSHARKLLPCNFLPNWQFRNEYTNCPILRGTKEHFLEA